MKSKILYLITAIIFSIGIQSAFGQDPLWNSDVNVMPQAGKYYKEVKTTVAFDGTIYLGRLYADSPDGRYYGFDILKSQDDGVTWSFFHSETLDGSDEAFTAMDIIAAGENTDDFRLYLAVPAINTATHYTVMLATRYNKNGVAEILSFNGEDYTYNSTRGFSSVSWATDSRKPSEVSNPYTISLAAAKAESTDEVIAWSTNDPSIDFHRKVVASSVSFMKNVSASIGVVEISPYPVLGVAYTTTVNGQTDFGDVFVRYFYADDLTSMTYPLPVGTGATDYGRPSLSLSQTRGSGSGPGYDDIRTIIAYNVDQSTDINTNFRYADTLFDSDPDFETITGPLIGGGAGDQMNPHVIFDPAGKNFVITYYDKNTGKLPFLYKWLGSPVSESFALLKDTYRDSFIIPSSNIIPRLAMNPTKVQAVFAWNDDYLSMFDAEYTMGVNDSELSILSVFPNPVKDILNINSQKNVEKTEVYNLSGQLVLTAKNQTKIDMSSLPAGNYVVRIFSADEVKSIPVIKK